jgi:acyl-CoA reductase-like NAD-dependent aldehyde dehydrogenase
VAQRASLSRTQAATLIASGNVTVSGRREKASYRPVAGELVVVAIPPVTAREVTAEAIPLTVVFEDDALLVVDIEEIFGPVLAAIGVRDAEEAVAVGNGVIYGLAAAVWTRDITRAHRIARALRAGVVYVNCYDADDITVPFGGFKQSGMGRDKSLHAFDKYTELKTTWIDLS